MTFFRDAIYRNLYLRMTELTPDVYQFALRESVDTEPVAVDLASFPLPHPALEEGLRLLRNYVEEAVPPDALTRLGKELAHLLPEGIYSHLCTEMRGNAAEPMRLWLEIEARKLDKLPWEFLGLPADGVRRNAILHYRFAGLHPRLHILRRPIGIENENPDPITMPPVRVLIAWADPRSPRYPELRHLKQEERVITESLGRNHVEIEKLPQATKAALERAMKEFQPHILHFMGHGVERSTGHCLVLHGGEQYADQSVYIDELARWTKEAGTRLVVLSACHTGDGAGGLAPTLARKGVAAVVGMQLALRDASAVSFAKALYTALAESCGLDIAVARGRQAIHEYGADWGVPVVYMGTADTHLFRLPPRTNLVGDETKFIGRDADIRKLCSLFTARDERCVTITGIGGMGKSRLAQQVARGLRDHFRDGVWKVDCEPLRRADEVLAAICATLDIRLDAAVSPQGLGQLLAGRRLLLLLDGFEKCASAASLLERILSQAPDVACLVTSRRVLHLPRELEYRLQPMPTVERGRRKLPDSVALFRDREARVVRDLKVNSENRALIRELCAKLEGIPFKIILAAGRRRSMSLEELYRQVGLRLLPPEMQAMIAEAYNDLPDNVQRLLAMVSVFEGGFGYGDAEAVCAPELAGEIYDILTLLRDHSLVEVDVIQDRARFRMLETVRDYLTTCSPPEMRAELELCRERHARHYARFAQQIDARMELGEWSEASAQFWREIANVRCAINYSIANGKQDLLLDLVTAVGRIYFEAGLWGEFETIAAPAQQAARALHRLDALVSLYGLLGALARRRQEEDVARTLWEERLALAQERPDLTAVADTLIDLACQRQDLKEAPAAIELLERATPICIEGGLRGHEATVYAMRSKLACDSGDMDAARSWTQKAEAVCTGKADKELLPFIYLTLGRVYRATGDVVRAHHVLRAGIRVALEGERTIDVGWFLLELAALLEQQRSYPHAACVYFAAEKMNIEGSVWLRHELQANLERFQPQHTETDLQIWRRPLRDLQWKEAVTYLLDKL